MNQELEQIRLHNGGRIFNLPNCDLSQPVLIGGNSLRIFNNGSEVFHDMLREISLAKNYILLESYIFRNDRVGKIFKKFLIKKAKEGVKVYVIFDGIGNLLVPHDFWLRLKRGGVRVFEYGPIRTFFDYLDSRKWVRDHRKTLVIDDRVAYLGGINIGHEYEKRWRDTHLKIEGAAATNIKKIFIDFWNNYKKHKITLPTNWIENDKLKIYYNNISTKQFPIRRVYLDFINRATSSLALTFSYFIPGEEFLTALIKARQRGVRVEIILPERSDIWIAQLASRSLVERLLRFGVKIFWYQKTMIHAKTLTSDGKRSIIGSSNLDNQSFSRSYEIAAEIEDSNFAQAMERMFACDKENCRELGLKEWLARPRLKVFWENFFGLLRNYL